MGDSMTSLLVPVGFLLMNIVILLIWWIVRRERQRISQIEEKVDTVGRIIMDIQYQQKRHAEQMGQFHGDHVMAEEVANSSLRKIPETMTEESEETELDNELDNEVEELNQVEEPRPRIEHLQPVEPVEPVESVEPVEHVPMKHMGRSQQDMNNDEHKDDVSEYGSELDSLTDDENVQIHNQNDAHEKISVSDVESLAESLAESVEESVAEEDNSHVNEPAPEIKTIHFESSQPNQSSQENSFQGLFELGEHKQERPQLDIQDSQDNETTQPHELDEERYKQLSKLTVKELRKLATEKGIRNVDKLKKKTLVIQLSVIPAQNHEHPDQSNQQQGEQPEGEGEGEREGEEEINELD